MGAEGEGTAVVGGAEAVGEQSDGDVINAETRLCPVGHRGDLLPLYGNQLVDASTVTRVTDTSDASTRSKLLVSHHGQMVIKGVTSCGLKEFGACALVARSPLRWSARRFWCC